jgi:hypothetical protein
MFRTVNIFVINFIILVSYLYQLQDIFFNPYLYFFGTNKILGSFITKIHIQNLYYISYIAQLF